MKIFMQLPSKSNVEGALLEDNCHSIRVVQRREPTHVVKKTSGARNVACFVFYSIVLQRNNTIIIVNFIPI